MVRKWLRNRPILQYEGGCGMKLSWKQHKYFLLYVSLHVEYVLMPLLALMSWTEDKCIKQSKLRLKYRFKRYILKVTSVQALPLEL